MSLSLMIYDVLVLVNPPLVQMEYNKRSSGLKIVFFPLVVRLVFETQGYDVNATDVLFRTLSLPLFKSRFSMTAYLLNFSAV